MLISIDHAMKDGEEGDEGVIFRTALPKLLLGEIMGKTLIIIEFSTPKNKNACYHDRKFLHTFKRSDMIGVINQ
jgi:hypothetical protein